MAASRGRIRNVSKSKDKVEPKNTLDRYSWSEKGTPTRERGMEIMREKVEEMEGGFEGMISEIKGIFEKQVEKLLKKIEEEKEKRERERESQRERRMGERKEKHDGNQKNRGGERESRERGKKKEHSNQRSGVDRRSSEETVKEFMREKLKIETEIERAQKIRVGDKVKIIVATMKSEEEKIRVTKGRRKLENGEYTKIGYKKLKIENRWYRWNEKEERLEEERKSGEEK